MVYSNNAKQNYPKELQHRIFNNKFSIVGRKEKIIIEEPEYIPFDVLKFIPEEMIELIIGTPIPRKISSNSWFFEKCKKYGCKFKNTTLPEEEVNLCQKVLHPFEYVSSYEGAFIFYPEK